MCPNICKEKEVLRTLDVNASRRPADSGVRGFVNPVTNVSKAGKGPKETPDWEQTDAASEAAALLLTQLVIHLLSVTSAVTPPEQNGQTPIMSGSYVRTKGWRRVDV